MNLLTSSVGSDHKATISGTEGEREVLDQGGGTRWRLAVNTWVDELEIVDLNCWKRTPLYRHFLLSSISSSSLICGCSSGKRRRERRVSRYWRLQLSGDVDLVWPRKGEVEAWHSGNHSWTRFEQVTKRPTYTATSVSLNLTFTNRFFPAATVAFRFQSSKAVFI